MKYDYKLLSIFSLLLYLSYELVSVYFIITSSCECEDSTLWMFCLTSGFTLPFESLIKSFSPQYIIERSYYTCITMLLVISNIYLLRWGIIEIWFKCLVLRGCYIWYFGIVNSSLILITIVSLLIFYIYNFNKFSSLPTEINNLEENFV